MTSFILLLVLLNKYVTFSLQQWRIQAVWEAGIPVWAPKLWCPKNTFQVILSQLYFNKYIEVAINDFTMHLIISKWYWIQKCKQPRKTMRQIDQSEKRNCQRKCFHSFNYVINHASIRFFFLKSSTKKSFS